MTGRFLETCLQLALIVQQLRSSADHSCLSCGQLQPLEPPADTQHCWLLQRSADHRIAFHNAPVVSILNFVEGHLDLGVLRRQSQS